MSYLDALILGIVEGITEFLPISSTGHLILAADLLGLPESEFLKTFQVAVQLGAIGAILTLYWRTLITDLALVKKILVALIPALGVGAFFYTAIRSLFESSLTVVVALFVGGIILVLFEWWRGQEIDAGTELRALSYQKALGIGLFQALSVIPGVSRAGATMLGGLMLGLKRKAVVEFSFLLALPTMLAATTLDFWQHRGLFSSVDIQLLLVGCVSAFAVAIVAVKFLLRFVENHTFMAFGIYRMIVALLFFLFVL